ncbi:unnamed protein product, partial [Scytosiphon promiscuus]
HTRKPAAGGVAQALPAGAGAARDARESPALDGWRRIASASQPCLSGHESRELGSSVVRCDRSLPLERFTSNHLLPSGDFSDVGFGGGPEVDRFPSLASVEVAHRRKKFSFSFFVFRFRFFCFSFFCFCFFLSIFFWAFKTFGI